MSKPHLETETGAYTPGPWVLIEINTDIVVDYQPVDLIRFGKPSIRLMNNRRDIADARLIAAAPDAWDLAQLIVSLDSSPLQRDNIPQAVRDAAKAFIAKATGAA